MIGVSDENQSRLLVDNGGVFGIVEIQIGQSLKLLAAMFT